MTRGDGTQAKHRGLTELKSRNECLGQLKTLELRGRRIREDSGSRSPRSFSAGAGLGAGMSMQAKQPLQS